MKRLLKLAATVLALLFIVALAQVIYEDLDDGSAGGGPVAVSTVAAGDADDDTPQYMAAFDFTCYDADGNAVQLSDFFGKPLVLNFWASWCGPCQAEMPDFETVFAEQGDQVNFLMVNLTGGSETQAAAQAFIAEAGYTFPVYFDLDGAGAQAYGVTSIPSTFIFDSNGFLAGYRQGLLSLSGLRQGLELAATQAEQTAALVQRQ